MKKHKIGENIKSLKAQSGLSWKGLAEDLSSKGFYIYPKTLESYGSGRTEPNIDKINELAQYFNLTIEQFCYGSIKIQNKDTLTQ
jgi:transcriptional regulator with XRE-family HTH domain